MKQEICWDLFKKLLNNNISDSELNELQHWRNLSELNQNIYDEILGDFEIQEAIITDKWNDPDKEWNKFKPLIKPAPSKLVISRKSLYSYAAVAAIFILFIGVQGSNLFKELISGSKIPADSYTYVYSPRGQRTQVILPDNTKVWLNSETSIKYSADFNQSGREVTVQGEAYFDVTKNPQKPFFVNTSELRLKVYGTSFNVKAYPEEETIETILVEGKLSVQSINGLDKELGNKELFLKPNEKLTYTKTLIASNGSGSELPGSDKSVKPARSQVLKNVSQKSISIKNKIAESEVLWKEGKLIFNDESFETLSVKLERWYDVKIHFTNEKIKKYRFTGSFERETINQAMEALKISSVQSYEYKIIFRDIYLK
ncbi:hypothetical protein MASR2M69_10190 [Bacteroidota bacterium]